MAWRLASEVRSLPWRNFAREAWDRTAITIKFLCFMHVTSTYVCGVQLTMGPSMLPTLNMSGDVLLVERISTRLGKIKPGDVVVARSPQDPRKTICKRVMGLEGDRVNFYTADHGERNQSIDVPKGHVWLQGDNLSLSNDSRHYGPVPYALLQGKLLLRIWPIDGFGFLK
eukprot:Gb_30941 [translate_table: standard]